MKLSLGLKIVLMKLVRVELAREREGLAYLERKLQIARQAPEIWDLKRTLRNWKEQKKIVTALQRSLREDFK